MPTSSFDKSEDKNITEAEPQQTKTKSISFQYQYHQKKLTRVNEL